MINFSCTSSHGVCWAKHLLAASTVFLTWGCKNESPQELTKPSPDAQASKVAPASPEQKKDAPLPDEFRRFEYDAEGRDDLEVGLNAEEVISGVRLQTEVNEAQPGTYLAVFHENGVCDGLDALKLGASVDLMSSGSTRKGPDGAQVFYLGEVEVDADGKGHARWLTAIGNLRENQEGSLLGGVFALYGNESKETLGKLVACVLVENQKS